MKRTAHVFLAALLLLPAAAAEPDLREQLRDALYTEEVDRDPAAAAERYQAIIEQFDARRPLAASALFRLAEIRRRQDRPDDAVALYQRLIREFPDAHRETELAREHLADLDGDIPEPGTSDPDTAELERLRKLARDSPDLLSERRLFENVIEDNQPASLAFLLEHARPPEELMLLDLAASRGFLAATETILEADIPPKLADIHHALITAAAEGYLQIATRLLEAGADPSFSPRVCAFPDSRTGTPIGTALMEALAAGNRNLIDLLLDAGADVNAAAGTTGYTPLHIAVIERDLENTLRLLKLGANASTRTLQAPRFMPVKQGGQSMAARAAPIHFVAMENDPDSMKIMRALTEHGADPNLLVEFQGEMPWDEMPRVPNHRVTFHNHEGPVDVAIRYENLDMLKALIDAGAKPRPASAPGESALVKALAKPSEYLRILLENGWDPNDAATDGTPLIAVAASDSSVSVEKVRLLLEAGANPNPKLPAESFGTAELLGNLIPNQTLSHPQIDPEFRRAAEMVDVLLQFGSKPALSDVSTGFRKVHNLPDTRLMLVKRFSIPAWNRERTVRLLSLSSNQLKTHGSQLTTIRPKDGTPAPPSLLMLFGISESPEEHYDTSNYQRDNHILLAGKIDIYRNGDTQATPLRVDLLNAENLPELKWGDVVDLSPADLSNADADKTGSYGIPIHTDLETYISIPAQIRSALHRRLRTDFTAEIDGETKRFTLSGARLYHDSVSATLPYAGLVDTVALLWPGDFPVQPPTGTVEVTREGMDPFPIHLTDLSRGKDADFSIREGDHLRLLESGQKLRNHVMPDSIVLNTSDGSYLRTWELPGGEQWSAAIPTLVQAIAEASSSPVPASQANPLAIHPFPLPPALDLSTIVIHRLPEGAESGETLSVEVDLLAAIGALGDDYSTDEARAIDVDLQPGDRIEIAPLGEEPEAFRSFPPKVETAFRKILSITVQKITDSPEIVSLDWAPITWSEIGGFSLPVDPESGTSTPTAAALFVRHRDLTLHRGSRTYVGVQASRVFLRQSDRIDVARKRPVLQPRVPNPDQNR